MNIPIVGGTKIGDDWMIILPIACACGQAFLLTGQVGVTRPCPKCGTLHRLMALPKAHPVTGVIHWPIGTAQPRIGDTDGKDG